MYNNDIYVPRNFEFLSAITHTHHLLFVWFFCRYSLSLYDRTINIILSLSKLRIVGGWIELGYKETPSIGLEKHCLSSINEMNDSLKFSFFEWIMLEV